MNVRRVFKMLKKLEIWAWTSIKDDSGKISFTAPAKYAKFDFTHNLSDRIISEFQHWVERMYVPIGTIGIAVKVWGCVEGVI